MARKKKVQEKPDETGWVVSHLLYYGNCLIPNAVFDTLSVFQVEALLKAKTGKKVKVIQTNRGNYVAEIVNK